MTGNVAINLGSVQKTLLLPLWGRAVESQKENPLMVDEAAVEIMQKIEYDFSATAQNMHALTQMAWIQRSLYTDGVVKRFLEKKPAGTVVNLGCGLDTTFERTDNGKLTWYDLDMPDVISLRRRLLVEGERRKYISASLFETSWLKEIQVCENVLFIAAGVLYYFEGNAVKNFLIHLSDTFPGSQIVFDASSPIGIKIANRKVIEGSGLDKKSFLKGGLKNANDLLLWDKRFRILDIHYYFKNNIRSFGLKNMMMGKFSDLMNIQYMVLLSL
jgi:O-methyltransferase involved in polyketide biosynthesis